jgi:glycerol-3-phosphate dehydrogenase
MATPNAQAMVAASQGVHIVLPAAFLPGETAIIVPKTSDGRVLFLIPWHDRIVVGTTDTPIPAAVEEPSAQRDEIEFLLRTAGEYLVRRPSRSDVLSVFVGIRPLVQSQRGGTKSTAKLSRDHTIEVSENGLVTITGGKWTTARHMAEDCVNRVLRQLSMPHRPCVTQRIAVHGSPLKSSAVSASVPYARSVLGTDLAAIEALIVERPALGRSIASGFPWRYAELAWAVRHEMARTLEDVLARRTRLLFLDARAAIDVAPEVARFMAIELGRAPEWVAQQLDAFHQLAQHYCCPTAID